MEHDSYHLHTLLCLHCSRKLRVTFFVVCHCVITYNQRSLCMYRINIKLPDTKETDKFVSANDMESRKNI